MRGYSINEEKIILSYFLKNPLDLKNYRKGFFENETLNEIANVLKAFYKKFKRTPNVDELNNVLFKYREKNNNDSDIDFENENDVKSVKEDISREVRDSLKLDGDYESDYIEKIYYDWIKEKTLYKAIVDIVEKGKTFKGNDYDSMYDSLMTTLRDARDVTKKSPIQNYINIELHKQPVGVKMESSYDFINNKTNGGFDTKTLNVYLAPPNTGKSIFLCNDAVNLVKNHKNVLFITCEMEPWKITKRIDGNLLGINLNDWNDYDRNELKKKLDKRFNKIPPLGNLFIVQIPTGKCSVDDVEKTLKDCENENNVKIDALIIDYINVMVDNKGKGSDDNTYIKIKNIAEGLRALAIEHNVVCITASQTNRSVKGQQWSINNMTIDAVAESSALTQTVDMMLGIIQDDEMYANCEYWLKILKIRDGEGKNMCCKINVNYDYMKLDETREITYPSI